MSYQILSLKVLLEMWSCDVIYYARAAPLPEVRGGRSEPQVVFLLQIRSPLRWSVTVVCFCRRSPDWRGTLAGVGAVLPVSGEATAPLRQSA